MRRVLALAALAALAGGCAAHRVDVSVLSSPSDQIVWDAAQKAIQKKDWEAARQYLRRIIDAFPQSEHQPQARIGLADTYFEAGGTANYVLAISSYREFLTLYPQHAKSDYAQFQVAESEFKQRNSPDRDQTATEKALEEYQRLLDVYPESSYVETARERIRQCRQEVARADYLVGWFYQRGRQAWRSAIGRYEIILTDYPDYEKTDEVLYRVSQCLAAAGRYAEALPYIGRLEKEFPKSAFLADAAKLRSTFPARSTPAMSSPAPGGPAKPADAPPAKPVDKPAGTGPAGPGDTEPGPPA